MGWRRTSTPSSWVKSPMGRVGDFTQAPLAGRQAPESGAVRNGLAAAQRGSVRRTSPRGFTLIELMLVVAIIGIMAAISVNEFSAYIMYAKRTEAVTGLATLWTAQQLYYAEHGRYAETFRQLDFEINGGTPLSPTSYKGVRYTYQLSQPWGATSYYCIATAQLDADPFPDVLEVYEFGE